MTFFLMNVFEENFAVVDNKNKRGRDSISKRWKKERQSGKCHKFHLIVNNVIP